MQHVGIAGGLVIVLLSAACYNVLLVLLPRHGSALEALAIVSAMLLFCLGWAVLIGATARKRNWTADRCYGFAIFSLMAIGIADTLLLSRFTNAHSWNLITLFICMGGSVGNTARKFAFPELRI